MSRNTPRYVDYEDNFQFLAARFREHLRALEPQSLLDVGCGSGWLLAFCREQGIHTVGLDPSERALARCGTQSPLVRARAEALPFQAGAFDWVILRHVLHHFAEPERSLQEAARVARVGVLAAEPWFDTGMPGQSLALQADNWLKRQHERKGMLHKENLDASGIMAALQSNGAVFRFQIETQRQIGSVRLDEFEAKARKHEPEGSGNALEDTEFAQLTEAIARHGMTHQGTLIVRAYPLGDT